MRAAPLLAALALLAASCGASKPAASVADVAPGSTYALLGGSTADVRAPLDLLPGGPRLAALLDRARAVTASSAPAWVAVLDPSGSRAVAFERPKDRTTFEHALEAAGVAHARVRGWVAFSRQRDAVEAVRHAKQHLADARWFREPVGRADATFLLRGLTVTADAHGDAVVARWTTPGVGGRSDAAHPLAAYIPRDALAAAAVHDGAAELGRFGVAGVLERGFGLRATSLARLAPRDAVVFARPGDVVPGVTVLATGSDAGAAARVVRELSPARALAAPATLDGVPVRVVSLGPIDLYAGSFGGRSVLTDDAGVQLRSKVDPLRPSGLPDATSEWAYLDVPQGLPALESLAALADTHLSTSFAARVAPLETLLVYVTDTRTSRTLVVDVRKRR